MARKLLDVIRFNYDRNKEKDLKIKPYGLALIKPLPHLQDVQGPGLFVLEVEPGDYFNDTLRPAMFHARISRYDDLEGRSMAIASVLPLADFNLWVAIKLPHRRDEAVYRASMGSTTLGPWEEVGEAHFHVTMVVDGVA